jgi:hypothetical protein
VFRFLVSTYAAIFKPRALLIAENICLHQQLLALQRRHLRPCLSNADRRVSKEFRLKSAAAAFVQKCPSLAVNSKASTGLGGS